MKAFGFLVPAGASLGVAVSGGSDSTALLMLASDYCTTSGVRLRDNGHDVQAAADGAQALEMAAAWMPEVVLLDINMPLVNGYEVARRLRAQFPPESMKLVMMSGIVLDNAARRGASEAGFDHCIDKVVDLAALEKLLEDAG